MTPLSTPAAQGTVVEPMFPIMGGPKVPWSLIAPYEHQAHTNHRQTLTRLAERGGLSICEAMAVMSSVRYEKRPIAKPTVEDWLDFIAERKARAERRPSPEALPASGVEAVLEAAKDIIASRSSTYKAKNGRVMGIEDDSGEMMWIVPFDEMAALEAALTSAPAPEDRDDVVRELETLSREWPIASPVRAFIEKLIAAPAREDRS